MRKTSYYRTIPIALLVLFLLPFDSFSQNLESLDIKAGINSSTFYNSQQANLERSTGIIAGLGLVYGLPITDFDLKGEVLYAQKGIEQNTATVSADYLVFSLQGRYSLAQINSYIFAGPYLGILINSKLENNNGLFNLNDDKKDIGFSVGAGFKFFNPFFVELRYDLGLNELDLFNQSATGKNSSFGLLLGLTI